MIAPLGFSGGLAEALAVWESNAAKWPHIGPPWRPSPGDVAVYRALLGERLYGRVLLLGATPELRDLLASRTRPAPRPIIVDMSVTMLRAMSALTRHALPDDEDWRVTDWCDDTLPAEIFDVVLADMVWWTLSVEKQLELRDRIAALLAPDGRFVSRFRFRISARIHDDPYTVIARHLAKLDRQDHDEQHVRDAMLSHLYDITVDVESMRMNRQRTSLLIESARDTQCDAAKRRFLNDTLERLIGADWTSQTRTAVEASLLETYALVGEGCASDYDAAQYPVLALGKRVRLGESAA